jgi:AraC-like DNA-binding protein/mannose-6-phosphate isomerase-like protein (cupin superfamily)
MHWLERLNRSATRAELGAGTTEILHWAYTPHLSDNTPHRHTYFEVCFVGRYGAGIFTVEDVPHAIAPGDVFFARPGVIHQIQNTQRKLMELFWVSWMWTLKAVEKSGDVSTLMRAFADSDVLVARDDGRIGALWNALQAVASTPLPGSGAQIEALSSSLLLAIAQLGAPRHALENSLENETVAPSQRLACLAVRYIHDNIDRRLPIEEIASHVHVSPRHLSRLIHEFTGASPAAYIETARMDRARALLHKSNLPIKEIAQRVGYNDVHHFTRVFSRSCGISPGAFRDGKSDVRKIQKPGDLV